VGAEKSIDNYEELSMLIAQFHSPNLSEGPEPTTLLETFSNLLPTLTDTQIRYISDAVENIDKQKTRLLAITEGYNASDHILIAYGHYNRLVMIGKLRAYIGAIRESERATDRFEQLIADREETENGIVLNDETIERLRFELIECEHTVSELREKHENEAEATKRLTLLKIEATNVTDFLKRKTENVQRKKTQINQRVETIKTLESAAEMHMEHISASLEKLGNQASKSAFEFHNVMIEEFDEFKEFDFLPIKEELKKRSDALREGEEVLRGLARLSSDRDFLRKQLDENSEILEQKNLEFAEAEMTLFNLKSELIQSLVDWTMGNSRLTILPDMIENIKNAVRAYEYTDGSLKLQPFVEELLSALRGAIEQRIGAKKLQRNELQEKKEVKQSEIRQLREVREIEPDRSIETIRSREQLKKHKIPFTAFYKFLQFKPEVDEKTANRIEEALSLMGILDALVIPEKYRETVLKISEENGGPVDKYMFFSDKSAKLEKNYDLSSILEVNKCADVRILVENVIKSIYYNVESHTTINSSGTFLLGHLTGTVTGLYVSRFIGEAARESNRQESIHALQIEIEEIIKQIDRCDLDIKALRVEIDELNDEYRRMPDMGTLAETAGIMRNLVIDIRIAHYEYERLVELLTPVKDEISGLNERALALLDQVRLPVGLEAYENATRGICQYNFDLSELIDEHNKLLTIVSEINNKEIFEVLNTELDSLLHDSEELEQRRDSIDGEIADIMKQLRDSEYEEAARTIGTKRQRIDEIRNCLEILQKTAGALESKLDYLEEDIDIAQNIRTARKRELALAKEILANEQNLGYTDAADLSLDDRDSVNKTLNNLELGKKNFVGKTAEDMEKEVHDRLFINLHYLSEYAPIEEELFQNSSDTNHKIKRIDISCNVKGEKVGLAALKGHLEKEIDLQRKMIKGLERELFETLVALTPQSKDSKSEA